MKTQAGELKGGNVFHQADEDPSGGVEGRKTVFIKPMKTQAGKLKGGNRPHKVD
ncbi:hypothetical protein [Mesobacillus foraminis]|uniref:hypothetical protein n=1 Tax=Mesobacillus foraminis TaxID=279826 RepID=UPI0013CF0591|nr:hypothetical protein [Mesobacillus foraminis]